MTGIVLFLH